MSIGMRGKSASSAQERYRTITGNYVERAVEASLGRLFGPGHCYAQGREGARQTNIGYSSGSKVWSLGSFQIDAILEWSKAIARKIRSDEKVVTKSAFDHLRLPSRATKLPGSPIAFIWPDPAYINDLRVVAEKGGKILEAQLAAIDVELVRFTEDHAEFEGTVEGIAFTITYAPRRFPIFEVIAPGVDITITGGENENSLARFLQRHPPSIFFEDFALLQGANHYESVSIEDTALAVDQIRVIDWLAAGVDVRKEVKKVAPGQRGIHQFVREELLKTAIPEVLIYDDGSGEIADFVALDIFAGAPLLTLYHCKGSGGAKAGERVEDVYEVCSQAVKSLLWLRTAKTLRDRILERVTADHERLVRGTVERIHEILQDPRRLKTEIIVVQPGVSQAMITGKTAQLFAAASAHLAAHGRDTTLRLWMSP